jgi:hypothetical protein
MGDLPEHEVKLQERVNSMISERIGILEGRNPAPEELPFAPRENTSEASYPQ